MLTLEQDARHALLGKMSRFTGGFEEIAATFLTGIRKNQQVCREVN